MKKKILILSGGISKERLISLDTGLQVSKELRRNGYNVKISEPNDDKIKIYESKAGHYASVRFGGWGNRKKVKNYSNVLYDKLKELDVKHIGSPYFVSYNSPYKVFNRRNEVMIKIEYKTNPQ